VVQKNNYQLVSRILFLNYHLSALRIAAEMLLPTRKLGRAALKRLPMWHYSMQGLPARIITETRRELLPHVFTLTIFQWQLFSVALSVLTEMRPGA
jgi:hypothetical protein